ncbi:MAG: YkvA family protein, partial [Alphaproteobacteria bacterium]
FWRKVRRLVGRVPFLEDAGAAYYCATDSNTPVRVKTVLIAALAYFVVPTDLIPDFIATLGFSDDAVVLFAAIQAVAPHIKDGHRAKARAALRRLSGNTNPGP